MFADACGHLGMAFSSQSDNPQVLWLWLGIQSVNARRAKIAFATRLGATPLASGAARLGARWMAAIYAPSVSVSARPIQCPSRERVARLLTTDVARHSLTSKANELLLFDQALGLTPGW